MGGVLIGLQLADLTLQEGASPAQLVPFADLHRAEHSASLGTIGRMAVTTRTEYETVIGIEVHAQLRTESKMFCDCPTAPPEGAPDEPNTRVCPVCLGLPGTLPVINRRAVELVMLTGLALDCQVETEAVRFERKNYFYPDLPKGYQISQYALPLTSNGRLVVPVAVRRAAR